MTTAPSATRPVTFIRPGRLRALTVAAAALAQMCLLVAALWFLAPPAWAQPARESAVKAAFLYKFGAFVEWPAGTFARPDQPLVIGVSGDDDLALDLEQLTAGRAIEGRPVQVRRVAEGGSGLPAVAGVHILYLAQRREPRLRDILEAVPPGAVVITDQAAGLRLGAVINFVVEDGRVRFSANLANAEARGLKLSSRLLAVAQSVEGRGR